VIVAVIAQCFLGELKELNFVTCVKLNNSVFILVGLVIVLVLFGYYRCLWNMSYFWWFSFAAIFCGFQCSL